MKKSNWIFSMYKYFFPRLIFYILYS
jgi:hypothetical protein